MDEMDKAEIKCDMRKLYKDLGLVYSLRVLEELLAAAEALAEVIAEELHEKSKNIRD